MVETVRSNIPVIPEQLLDMHPSWAKSSLAEYWKEQAKITRHHAEERGISGQSLGLIAIDIWNMMKEDAENFPDTFGGELYTTVYIDGLVQEQYAPLIDAADESFRDSATRLAERYFGEVKRSIIFNLCREEDIKAVCYANGGIPTVTEEELFFYNSV